jgi:hypothetical protein
MSAEGRCLNWWLRTLSSRGKVPVILKSSVRKNAAEKLIRFGKRCIPEDILGVTAEILQ